MKLLKKIISVITAAALAGVMFTGCVDKDSPESSKADSGDNTVVPPKGDVSTSNQAEFTIEIGGQEAGSFVITLDPEVAPITCENFKKLVNEGFYDGLTFHRVVDGFMAQGGDPNGDGTGGSPDSIKGEFAANGVDNTLSHTRGIVSMARSQDPDSASSQFFICYADCSFLDGSYAAFGEVTEGMDVVDSFLNVERDYNSGGELAVPKEPIVIKKAVLK